MGKTASFVIGGLLGAGVALLLAPRTGAETRAMVGEMASGFINSPAGDSSVSVKEAWDNAFAKGEEFFTKGCAVVSAVAGGAYSKVADVAGGAYTRVADVAGDAYSKVADVAGDAFVKAQDVAAVAVSRAQGGIAKVAAKAQSVAEDEVIPVFTEKDDELRAKMEAARQRIAEQIAKNAADARARAEAAAAAVVEDAAKAVEDAAEAVEQGAEA